MLPPVLEIYVVHHPDDLGGAEAASQIFAHFHGTSFSGLVGGAIEVYARSHPWQIDHVMPRPIPYPDLAQPNGVPTARLVAVVPVLSLQLAQAVQRTEWEPYIESLVDAQMRLPGQIGIFPLAVDEACNGSLLADLLQQHQRLAAPSGLGEQEPSQELLCRDLAQGIAQMILGSDARLQVFISHTRRTGSHEEDIPALIRIVREIIGDTRLSHFFDANDLQPGRDWDTELRQQAASSALLALRTDLYASRAWCQREMLIAKQAGMPVVILDSLGRGEERGSFIMDHIPRIPVRDIEGSWSKDDIRRGLNLLVDECLKRALWRVQQDLAANRQDLAIAWWAPHAPEPVTLAHWLRERQDAGQPVLGANALRILHPDPPLGPDERASLLELCSLMGHTGPLEIMTPRALSARGA